MPKSKLVTIDLKTDPQMSEAIKKLSPALLKASESLKQFGSMSHGLGAGTLTFTESLKSMKTAIEQLKSSPLTAAELEQTEFMMALKNVYTTEQAMGSKEDAQKLGAIVYLAGGSISIPMEQLEEAHFILGDKANIYRKLLLTPGVQKWKSPEHKHWMHGPFDLELFPNNFNKTITIYSKMKTVDFMGFDLAGPGADMTSVSLMKQEYEFMEHHELGGKSFKIATNSGKSPVLSGTAGSMAKALGEVFLETYSKLNVKAKKKVSGYDQVHWLLVGGPKHGESVWIKGNVSTISMQEASLMIPHGLSMPPDKHPMMLMKTVAYQGHDIVVDGYRYRIGAMSKEEFENVPFDEYGKYIEEVGLTPFDSY